MPDDEIQLTFSIALFKIPKEKTGEFSRDLKGERKM